MGANLELKRAISRLTWGTIDTLGILFLHQLALGTAYVTTPGRSSGAISSAMSKADLWSDELVSSFERAQLKDCWENLKRKGLIESIKGKRYEIQITKLGIEKLKSKIPTYRTKRPWDKRIYLVNYDIAEKERQLRDRLRDYLKEIGCGSLQKSTYISVYNPRGLLRPWIMEHYLAGEVLVSDLGPDGSLGDKSVTEIIAKAYELDVLNAKYSSFLDGFLGVKDLNNISKNQLAFQFLSILKEDPQLPFELLPDWWVGDRAYRKYKTVISV